MKILILAATALTTTMANANFTFEWEGVIDYFYEVNEGTAPESISLGNTVSGKLQFDHTGYDEYRLIQGNYSGPQYTFTESLLLEFRVGGDVWSFSGSNVSLQWVNTTGPTTQLFQSHSTSRDFSFESFPGYAGSFNVGFFTRDEVSPLAFWDYSDIELATFNIDQFTSGGGGISTFQTNANDDIIDGYSFDFDVTSLSLTTVPEPSTCGLVVGLMAFATISKRMGRSRR